MICNNTIPIKTEYFLFGLLITLIFILIFLSFANFNAILYNFFISFTFLEANPGKGVFALDNTIPQYKLFLQFIGHHHNRDFVIFLSYLTWIGLKKFSGASNFSSYILFLVSSGNK